MPKDSPQREIWQAIARAVTGEKVDFASFDQHDFLWFAADQGVCQLLDARVQNGTACGLNENTCAALATKSRDQVALDMLQSRDARHLLALLAEHDVPTLLLKGAPLAYLYYENSFQRPRTDTDLYIQEEHTNAVLDLLAEKGYSIYREPKRKLASKQFVASITSFQNISSHFDIHWKLSNRIVFRSCLPFGECVKQRQTIPALGPHAYTLSTADLLLHSCIHRIAHGRNTERNRLIWLYDIHLLAQSMHESEKERFSKRVLEKEIGCLCADALRLTEQLFGTYIPKNWLAVLESNRRNEPTARLIHSSKLRWAWADLMALEGVRNKAKYATELLFH